ncbi:POTRA domain-containing protein [Diaphorobacter aerolatus]|uniref:POTRA domain-containing protein n=1 Tax=Diaphorobacter aerolatus TaxID=1288495 RepID=UPI001D006DB8|nr:POTRA domain-containing protein [Diaphorobacter aerolatus]
MPTTKTSGLIHRERGFVGLATLLLVALAHGKVLAQSPSQQLPLLPAQMGCDGCSARDAAPAAPGVGDAAFSSTAAAPSFRLSEVRFYGAQAIDDAELKALAQPYVGRDVTLADLEAIAASVTALYRERGYLLAQAIVPVQTVREGVVDISVIEGRIGKVEVNLDEQAPIGEERVTAFLSGMQPGEVVHGPRYERAMLLLSDQPGIRVASTLQEGTQVGTTDLMVDVNAARRWIFVAEADNHGTKESGRFRVGAPCAGRVRWALATTWICVPWSPTAMACSSGGWRMRRHSARTGCARASAWRV